MQINRGPTAAPNPLFGFTSSPTVNTNLCNNTRANIAAGATRLAALWEMGRTGNLPVVNDQNPRFPINWYYALSSYNGGPANRISDPPVGRRVNNPNCDGEKSYCDGAPNDPDNILPDYELSRDPGARWLPTPELPALPVNVYPYQERVLYNMQFPRQPTRTQWTGADIGLRATRVNDRETGIIPADSLFEGIDANTGARFSRAPDLLLFRTQIGIVNQRTFPAEITIAYDLPIAANVTIELLDADDTPIDILVSARRLPEPGAAFNIERFPYSGSIGPGYGYRIRAEVNGFEGEYLRPLRIVDDDFDAAGTVFLPVIRR
jgi:hypothetical protein